MMAPIASGEVGGLTCFVLAGDVHAIVLPSTPDGSERTAWFLEAAARATPILVSAGDGACVAYDAVELMAQADDEATGTELVVDLVRLGVGALTLEVDRGS